MEHKECCQCEHCQKTKERSPEEFRSLMNRLKRIQGQLRGIENMLENNAYCTDIMVQTAAVTAALNSFNRQLLAVRSIADQVSDQEQMTIEQWQEAVEATREKELWQQPLESLNLSQEQYDMIWSLLITVPESHMPDRSACYDDIDLMRFHYLDQKVKDMETRHIKHKYAYLIKMLKNDLGK